MSAQYTITAVESGPREYTGAHGPMKAWKLTLQGAEGATHKAVELSQKPETREPQAGDVLMGTMERKRIPRRSGDGDFEVLKFTKDSGGGGFGGGGRRDDPAKTADIHRQVAIKAASTLFAPMLGQVDPMTSTTEWWTRFWALYDRTVDRLELAIQERAKPYGEPTPLRRDTTVVTGASDVPSAGAEGFSHPQGPDDQFEPPAAA